MANQIVLGIGPTAADSDYLRRLADSKVEGAQLPPYPDPRLLAVALGFAVRPVVRGPRACVVGRRIDYRWMVRHDETDLNAFFGLAMALLDEPEGHRVYVLASYLALPQDLLAARNLAVIEVAQPHVPRWFIEATLAMRMGSGVMRRIVI